MCVKTAKNIFASYDLEGIKQKISVSMSVSLALNVFPHWICYFFGAKRIKKFRWQVFWNTYVYHSIRLLHFFSLKLFLSFIGSCAWRFNKFLLLSDSYNGFIKLKSPTVLIFALRRAILFIFKSVFFFFGKRFSIYRNDRNAMEKKKPKRNKDAAKSNRKVYIMP